jgi:hypothetical protein
MKDCQRHCRLWEGLLVLSLCRVLLPLRSSDEQQFPKGGVDQYILILLRPIQRHHPLAAVHTAKAVAALWGCLAPEAWL